MNKSKLKSYAPAARREFIQAVTDRAHLYGLSENKNETQPVEEKGDVAIIGGRAFPRKIAAQRKNLEQRIEREGFAQVMEAVAYTWFNRLLALRYMEIHGYLEHGFRVLSNPGGSTIPEILEQAAHIQLPGLDQKKAVELKLDGSKDAELYRMILVAQCNALNTAMPFLFERIDDETELLLPDNLLHSDSLIRKLVTEIDEEDWQQVEIIGWLYQFYISEKKDQVIGKVVKPEDIPAATQLFTPNWIVKYMVQNSLGRIWLATYPNSSLKSKMEYYIEPAEQTAEVKAQLDAITPKELNPETITLLDPASGSGHILVEAYDLFKEIYLERGYRSRDIPRLILEKNLFGLDIDDRAAQMSGFALLMKARADDRRILKENSPRLNVMAIQGSEGIDSESIASALLKEKTYSIVDGPSTIFPETITQPVLTATQKAEIDKNDIYDLLELFKQGKNFGSLIQVPDKIAGKLRAIANLVESNLHASDIFTQKSATTLLHFVRMAMELTRQYDCVVANPPYMGSRWMNDDLASFAANYYPECKTDLMSCFMERANTSTLKHGYWAMINIPSWMFLSSFERFRLSLLDNCHIESLLHLGRGIFGSDFGTVAFVIRRSKEVGAKGVYRRLFDKHVQVRSLGQIEQLFFNKNYGTFVVDQSKFIKLPGSPIGYWVSNNAVIAFTAGIPMEEIANPRQGMKTLDNERFIRYWFEVSFASFKNGTQSGTEAYQSGKKWFPINHGGVFRKWYGNNESVVNWKNDGLEIKELAKTKYNSITRTVTNLDSYFKPGITWTVISSGSTSFRFFERGFLFSNSGQCLVPEDPDVRLYIGGFLNSKVCKYMLEILSPTLGFESGYLKKLPIIKSAFDCKLISRCIEIAKLDWNNYETSWDFEDHPILKSLCRQPTVKKSYSSLHAYFREITLEMKHIEEENNRLFIDIYTLQDDLSANIQINEITLTCNPYYRYGGIKMEDEVEALLLADTIREVISYSIGCMMGRYSLDEPGLIYANSGSVGFDSSKYKSFPADDDGIIPVMDMDWFEDDAASRIEEFLGIAWSPETLEENLKFVADSLSPKAGETPRETIRRYFSTQFYKDHMQTYKKRPIYWMFSSGKQRAFECLVYLHRYNEATLSRMRNEYVTPLQGKFSARVEYLSNEINAAASTSARTKLQKQLDALKKKQVELAAFDDLLRHYADKRIPIDLDDGVKVNYGKFGNLLAEVKAVTGGDSE